LGFSEIEGNDTIAEAQDTNLSPSQTTFTVEGSIDVTSRSRRNLFDKSEDIDLYKMDLKAGDTVKIDVDSVEYFIDGIETPQRLDSELRVFNAEGVELATNNNGAAPDELFVANRDPYLEFTAIEEGTYYVGVAQLLNRIYNPLTAENSSGWVLPEFGINIGEYTLNIDLDSALPEVSLAITPAEVVEEDPDAAFSATFTVAGEIPEVVFDADGNYVSGGLSVFLDVKEVEELGVQFEDFSVDGLTFGPGEAVADQPNLFEFILFEETSSVTLTIFNDIIEEEPFTFNFELVEDQEGTDYTVNSDANMGSFTLIDGNGGPGVGPTIGLSVSETDLLEGDELTVNFAVTGETDELPSPDNPLTVLVSSDTFGALGEFAIFDENNNPLYTTTGIEGILEPADGFGSSFFATLIAPDASITLSVFDDGPGEGEETLDFTLVNGEIYEVDPDASSVTLTIDDAPTEPIVSFSTTPEIINEADGTVMVMNFSVIGEIPEGGITVNLEGDASRIMEEFTAGQVRVRPNDVLFYFLRPSEVVGGTLTPSSYDVDPNSEGFLSDFSFTITDPNASLSFTVLDDIAEEPDQTFTYTLGEGEGYTVDETANSGTFTVTDGVPGGVGPTVGVTAVPTTLIEPEQTLITATFTVDGDIPDGGLVVQLQGPPRSIAEFDINATNPRLPEEETEVEGVVVTGGSIVGTDEVAGSLFLRITEATATVAVEVFDDGPNEGKETFTFKLVNGEEYEVDPMQSEVTITIDDLDEQRFFGTTGDDEFEAGISPDGFNASNDLVFAGAGDDLFETSTGNGNNRLYGQSGDDLFFLGSNDTAFGGSGNDEFYLFGGDNIISGGSGADQFWVALGEIPESFNTITDFQMGIDVIGIGGLGIGFSDLTLTQDNGDALIATDDQELAKLLGVNASSLTANNFVFA
jgi:hypothetical protein